MDYIEVNCTVIPPVEGNDIFMAWFSEFGFESFVEGETGFLAYIPCNLYSDDLLVEIMNHPFNNFKISCETKFIESINWNAEWEKSYPLVNIDNRCVVRAPFHQINSNVEFDIIIEPKMSFGTAHHETTSSIIHLMLSKDFTGKKVLDMGAGTGVLAILALKMGASVCFAIDNDEWAYENNIENAERNKVKNCNVILGDANSIPDMEFDVILANINRNILLRDMMFYVNHLAKNGIILFSGFYQGEDFEMITQKANSLGLNFIRYKENNKWMAAEFIKD